MQIKRDKLFQEFSTFAETGSGIVVGPPGVGKTVLLKTFCDDTSGRPGCLYLPVDKLGITNETELETALAIKTDFMEFLKANKPSDDVRGILVIDALDSARSETAKRFFLNLINRALNNLGDSWNIIVSVRTYDALKSQELQDLFPPQSNSAVADRFRMPSIYCRHFSIPVLDDEEREEAISSIQNLRNLYEGGSSDFKELLRIPFNLWLVEKIITSDGGAIEFSTTNSDTQLLGLFWKYRVTSDSLRDENQFLLSRAARSMVETRSLSVRTDVVYSTGSGLAWTSLLAGEVLELSDDGQRIGFYHNILFDYAVSILLMEDDARPLTEFLTEDPSRTLFLRPSLAFYFTRLWHNKREVFWHIFWEVLPSTSLHVRLFARLIPPSVVVNEARTVEDLKPILQSLSQDENLGTEATRRILQAYRMLDSLSIHPWTAFFISVSTLLRHEFAWDLAIITNRILELAQSSKIAILESACGSIARNLQAWVLEKRSNGDTGWFDHLGAVWGVPLVAKTFATDTRTSRALFEQILKFLEEPNFSITYFHQLADHVGDVWDHDAEFVERLYREVYAHHESSDEKTPFGTPVVPMTSTRRQDFRMCHYILAKEYPKLLKSKPIEGTQLVLRTLNRYVLKEQVARYKSYTAPEEPSHFGFRGGEAKYSRDHSYFWDTSLPDDGIELGGHLFYFIAELASSGDTQTLGLVLDEFRDHAEIAFFWKRLLDVGSRSPEIFAGFLFELCIAQPILLGSDTEAELQGFIEVASPYFSEEQRLQLESIILQLAERAGDDSESIERWKKRVLARIPKGLLVLDETKQLRQEMEDSGNVPAATPKLSFTMTSAPFTEEDWLRDQGIDLEKVGNSELRSLAGPLRDFNSRWFNKTPEINDIESLLAPAKIVYGRLTGSPDADEQVVESTWTELAMCAAKMSQGIGESASAEFRFCREVLLSVAKHPSPYPDPEIDANYSSPGWSPAPRIEAAQGLPWLARLNVDEDVLAAIENLVDDASPSVRFLVVSELIRLLENTPGEFWRLAGHVAENEQNKVVQEALFRTLSYTAIREEDKTVKVFNKFFSRGWRNLDEIRIWGSAAPTVVGLAFVRQNTWAIKAVDAFLDSPVEKPTPLGTALYNCIPLIAPERLRNPENLPAAERTIAWMINVVEFVSRGLEKLVSDYKAGDLSQEVYYENLKGVYDIIDDLVMRLYFAAKIKDRQLNYDEEPITDEERSVYYFKVKTLLKKIIDFAVGSNGFLFAPTAYHFMQLLMGVLEYDPKGAISMAAGVARSSESFSYTIDSMAIAQMVDMVERILADFREDVRDGQPLEDLLSLLDLFASTGDSSALRLVWRLDEIYR